MNVVTLLLNGFLLLPLTAHASGNTAANAQPAQEAESSGTIEPQIVRISYLEGDVRVARGTKGAAWEAAVTGLPIETGFSLATGKGRAEIEFEDSSTVYLGENSVLNFNILTSADDVSMTDIALLTGTVTLNTHPVAHEVFTLRTPTNRLTSKAISGSYERVTSYLDAMALTPQDSMSVGTPSVLAQAAPGPAIEHLAKGQTTLYHADGSVTAGDHVDAEDFTQWDQWVGARVTARATAVAAMMKESGLSAPIPGLADLYGKGTFFACQPYGTCWEPKGEAAEDASAETSAVRAARLTRAHLSVPGAINGFPGASLQRVAFAAPPAPAQYLQSPLPGQTLLDNDDDFPCYPPGVRSLLSRNNGMASSFYSPYDWALCHAGSWVYRHHYVWVAGVRKHHHCPVRWVKAGHVTAFVPIHPRDTRGKPPLNGEHEVFTVTKRGSFSVERTSLAPGAKVKLLEEAPREARAEFHQPLTRAADPAPELHRAGSLMARDSGPREAGTKLTFDHHSQSFTLGKAAMMGGHNVAQLQSFNRSIGTVQSRTSGVVARGGFSGSGGVAHSSPASSGASSSGASHASGGGGAASGGGHR